MADEFSQRKLKQEFTDYVIQNESRSRKILGAIGDLSDTTESLLKLKQEVIFMDQKVLKEIKGLKE